MLRNVIGVRYVSVIIEKRRDHADFESLFRTSDPDPRPFGADQDPWIRTLIADPALFFGDFQYVKKKISPNLLAYYFLQVHFSISLQSN